MISLRQSHITLHHSQQSHITWIQSPTITHHMISLRQSHITLHHFSIISDHMISLSPLITHRITTLSANPTSHDFPLHQSHITWHHLLPITHHMTTLSTNPTSHDITIHQLDIEPAKATGSMGSPLYVCMLLSSFVRNELISETAPTIFLKLGMKLGDNKGKK